MKLWTEGDITERNFPWTLATLERGRRIINHGFERGTGLVDLMKYVCIDTMVVFRYERRIVQGYHAVVSSDGAREEGGVHGGDPGDSRFYSAGLRAADTGRKCSKMLTI